MRWKVFLKRQFKIIFKIIEKLILKTHCTEIQIKKLVLKPGKILKIDQRRQIGSSKLKLIFGNLIPSIKIQKVGWKILKFFAWPKLVILVSLQIDSY